MTAAVRRYPVLHVHLVDGDVAAAEPAAPTRRRSRRRRQRFLLTANEEAALAGDHERFLEIDATLLLRRARYPGHHEYRHGDTQACLLHSPAPVGRWYTGRRMLCDSRARAGDCHGSADETLRAAASRRPGPSAGRARPT